jgi:hypothetical protein
VVCARRAWSVLNAERPDELSRFQRLLDLAFAGGATCSDAPEDRVVFPLLVLAKDVVEEILSAVNEGFGRAALRSVRTLYECVVTARFLSIHPEKAEEFLNTFHAQWARILQNMRPEERPPSFDHELAASISAYAEGRRVGVRQVDWSRKGVHDMAQEAGSIVDLHALAFDLTTAYIHPSIVSYQSEWSLEADATDASQLGESAQMEEEKFAINLAFDLILNAAVLRLRYAPSEALQTLVSECKDDFIRIWGNSPHI